MKHPRVIYLGSITVSALGLLQELTRIGRTMWAVVLLNNSWYTVLFGGLCGLLSY